MDETYKDFSTRMDKYRHKLEGHLGMIKRLMLYSKKQPKHFVLTIFFIFGNLGIPSIQDPLSLDNASITSTDSGHVSTSSESYFFSVKMMSSPISFVYFSSTFFAHFR